jgi:hypothetical protein
MTEKKREKQKWGPHNALRELLTVKLNTTYDFYGDFEQPLDMLREIADDFHSMNIKNSADTRDFMLSCCDLYALFRVFKREVDRLILDCIGLMQDMGEENMIGPEFDRFTRVGPKDPNWVKETTEQIVSEIEDKLP